jgi:hypothetical protein
MYRFAPMSLDKASAPAIENDAWSATLVGDHCRKHQDGDVVLGADATWKLGILEQVDASAHIGHALEMVDKKQSWRRADADG